MSTASTIDPILPTEEEAKLAEDSLRSLFTRPNRSMVRIAIGDESPTILELPRVAVTLLLKLLEEIARGSAVTVIPYHAELTTQQAADFLNVSRPFLIKLLERKELPFHRVGTHRRIQFRDVMEYKIKLRKQGREALNDLTRQSQDLDLGY